LTRALSAIALLGAALAACSTIADLELTYGDEDGDASTDAGRRVRDSSFEAEPGIDPPTSTPSTQAPCSDTDPDAACDFSQGLGCCLKPGASACIYQSEAPALCAGGVFVGCREGDNDNPCCWRTVNGMRVALHAASCNAGPPACIVHDGGGSTCEGTTCVETSCAVGNGGIFKVGACGAMQSCP
jgi:hypothetical protein